MLAGARSALVVVAALGLVACARAVSDEPTDDTLLAPNAALPAPLDVCVETECPAPLASCGPGDKCTTDTSRDISNCGACGNGCPALQRSLHATPLCSNGGCTFACDPFFADCNKKPFDGCEVSTEDDPKNCGGCGITCKEGEICWRGACGCPNGFTTCGSDCKNLKSDETACGSCDQKCEPPAVNDPKWICGPGVQPTHTDWECADGGCAIQCKGVYANCDGDLCKNGCEVDTLTDHENCGACGHACAANQDCVNGACLCPEGATRCGNRCVDTDVDLDNCGGCGISCPGANDSTANGTPTCTGGHCGYTCYPGFADCNGRINDGCEVNVGTDPKHCGGCGTSCDVARGQPCVAGKCLTKPCGPVGPTQ